METRVALIGIIVETPDSVGELNAILHDYGKYIIGRMGIPYRQRGISIISIAVDAPQDVISALSGKIGKLADYFCATTGTGTATNSAKRFGQEIAPMLKDDGIDAVILTST